MAYYLIDFENVKSRGMEGVELLSEEDTVCIFYSDNADSMTFDLHQKLNETKAKIIYHKVAVGTKNALDFQLATYLGYLICEQQREGIHPNYFIVTKDNGFTSLLVYWKAQGVPVRIIRNLLWGKNPSAEQNLLPEETAEELSEEPEVDMSVMVTEDVVDQPENTEEIVEPAQTGLPEPEKNTDTEQQEETPEVVDEPAEPVKKPAKKKNNTRKATQKKNVEAPDELTVAVEKVLTDQTIVPQVVKFIRQYKTKQGINNALNKEFKDSKRTSEIYSAIKPLIADKKGK